MQLLKVDFLFLAIKNSFDENDVRFTNILAATHSVAALINLIEPVFFYFARLLTNYFLLTEVSLTLLTL